MNWPFDDETKEQFLTRIKERTNKRLKELAAQGLFELDENCEPIAPAHRFKIKDLPPDTTMAYIVHKIGMFPSVTQARKNGFNNPLKTGEFFFTKKKIRVIIEE